MNKSISSQPDAARFRSIAVIILVLICISVFLTYTEHLTEKAEVIARDRVITDIRYSLAMMLFDYTVKGKQHELNKFDRSNPFVPLAIYSSLPRNYRGVVAEITAASEQGWYFDSNNKIVIYVTLTGERREYDMRYRQDSLSEAGSLYLQQKY